MVCLLVQVGEKSTRVVESFDRNGTKFVVVTFERALRKNAGLYVCKGRNSVGNDSKSYNLDVLCKTCDFDSDFSILNKYFSNDRDGVALSLKSLGSSNMLFNDKNFLAETKPKIFQ